MIQLCWDTERNFMYNSGQHYTVGGCRDKCVRPVVDGYTFTNENLKVDAFQVTKCANNWDTLRTSTNSDSM